MKVPLDPAHRRLRTVTVIAAALLPVYFVVGSFSLTGELPVQYSFSGAVSRTGSVTEARFSVIFLGVVAIGMTILAHFPHTYSHLVDITEDNKRRQYRNAMQMMIWLAAAFVGFQVVMVGNWLHGLPIILAFIPLAGMAVMVIYFLSRMFRLK